MSNLGSVEPNSARLRTSCDVPPGASLQPRTLPLEFGDSLRWLEARLVRHVEEVVAGAETTQNLLRNELQQEIERVAERQSVQLSKGEAAHMELCCRLDDTEKRLKMSQQDQLTEIVSLRSRLEATIGERLSCKLDDNEQRLRSLQQEQRNEVSMLRARIEEATISHEDLQQNVEKLQLQLVDCRTLMSEPSDLRELQQKTSRLEDRVELDSARFAANLTILEEAVASLAHSKPMSATLEQNLTQLFTQVESMDKRLSQFSCSSSLAASPTASPSLSTAVLARLEDLELAVAAVTKSSNPTASNVELELLHNHLAQPNGSNAASSNAELELLKRQLAQACINIDHVSKQVAEARDAKIEHTTTAASVNHNHDEMTRQTIARCMGEVEAELRVAIASKLIEARATLAAETQAEIVDRIAAIEQKSLESVKTSLDNGFQSAVIKLCQHARQTQSAPAEVKNLEPRLSSVEAELRGTIQLVTSLASRALEGKPVAASTMCDTEKPAPGGGFNAETKAATGGVAKTMQSVIHGAFHSSTFCHNATAAAQNEALATPSLSTTVGTTTSASTTAEAFSDTPLSTHDESEGSARSESGGQQGQLSEGLMESLECLAQAIDKTLKRPLTHSPEPSRGNAIQRPMSQSLVDGLRLGGSMSMKVAHLGDAGNDGPAKMSGSPAGETAVPSASGGFSNPSQRVSLSRGRSPVDPRSSGDGLQRLPLTSPRLGSLNSRYSHQVSMIGSHSQASRLPQSFQRQSSPPADAKLAGSFSPQGQGPFQVAPASALSPAQSTRSPTFRSNDGPASNVSGSVTVPRLGMNRS